MKSFKTTAIFVLISFSAIAPVSAQKINSTKSYDLPKLGYNNDFYQDKLSNCYGCPGCNSCESPEWNDLPSDEEIQEYLYSY